MALYQVSYGSFACEFVRLHVDERVIYDEANISQVGTTYTFNIDGVIAEATIALFQSKIQCANAAFSKPRLAFLVQWRETSGDPWTDLYNITSASDISFGPHPESFNVQQFSGGKAGIYSASVRCDTKDCYSNCTPFGRPSEILSITRRWDYAINPNGFTTRTVTGKLLVTSQSVLAGRPADFYRAYVDVDTPVFYKRDSQNFTQSEDGRTLSFLMTDQEVYWNLPEFVSDGQASFGYKFGQYNMTGTATLTGHFEAPKAVPFQAMLVQVYSLIHWYINPVATNAIAEEASVRQGIQSNTIDFVFTYSIINSLTGQSGFADGSATGPFNTPGGWQIGQGPPDANANNHATAIGMFGGSVTSYGGENSGVISPSPPLYDSCTQSTTPPVQPQSVIISNQGSGPNASTPQSTGSSGGSSGDAGIQSPGGKPTGIKYDAWRFQFHEYHQVFSYTVDNGYSVFTPKIANGAPLFQRTRIPTMIVIQTGYQKQLAPNAENVSSPPAPATGDNGTVLNWYISPSVGEPYGNGGNSLYTTNWMYKIQYNKALPETMSELEIMYPTSPILETDNGGRMPNLPNLLPT